MNNILKIALITIIILSVSACGFRQHEQALINEQAIQTAIAMNTPACNPSVADCGLTTGGF